MVKVKSYKDYISEIFQSDLTWKQLCDCNVLVTGATGLIGHCLVEVLLLNNNINCQVFVLGRSLKRLEDKYFNYRDNERLHFVESDIGKDLNCDITFKYIIHAASPASPNFFSNNPVEVIKSNIYGVSNLVEYGLKHGMKRFLYISSGEIYGEGDGRMFTEEYLGYVDCLLPRSCYPSSKRTAETLCVSYIQEYNADIVIARPCHVYGPFFNDNDNRVYAQFIRNILNNEDIVMKSDGSQLRSWCFVVDCVSALLCILFNGECGQAYNIADNNSIISIKELAGMIAKMEGRDVVIQAASYSEKKGFNFVTKSVYDISKLMKLGWSVDGNMTEKMYATIRECKKWI